MSLWTETRGYGPELVLLHGWGLSSEIWGEFADRLSERYRVTLIDLPGLGRSVPAGDMSLHAVVQSLLEVAPEQAHWVGWSLGGQLALAVAEHAPERVKSLSLVASNPCFVARDDWPCAMAPEVFGAFVDSLADNEAKTLQRFAALQTRGSDSARDELKRLKSVIVNTAPEALAAALMLLESDLRKGLAGIRCPVQLILGAEDQLVPVSLAANVSRLNQHLDVWVLERGAHLPFISHADQVLQALNSLTGNTEGVNAAG
ncbi:pimeloyl-ACP methyl ester esterase BioH [Marinobacterium sediminicola]|uniref:Pimeloyl-[acyl-carrier protein] methyl ester esterase n=1 Tax=Marinobacterium sediminicola TaxID=518898 RepID=A0ABY1RZT7_9GAMM|nr:pimeloyl-ACP methyl ester esterase BioH [Marinobacterium sediminicola]ULG70003.1 pimeloyl-ACP methyl ester esterase BioH [Marinobacterium sediminicola]SMR74457.1 pimeloyl-[acyl-carrier protein] methyl ester esterase [Marinobacterium sediminicola]